MSEISPILDIDFYKATHGAQYPKQVTKIVSYFTPRMSRIDGVDKVVMFGLQAFINEYLIYRFNRYFFNVDKKIIIGEYKCIMDATLGTGSYELERIEELYDLGYLPIEIRAIPEGSRVDIKAPMIEVTNTHPRFAWLVGAIETMLSVYMWHTIVSANVGYEYRKIVDEFYDMSVDDDVRHARALGDFSMRGQESAESAAKSSGAFLLSFLNTATVPAIPWLEDNYNCDCTQDEVGFGAISTEHSVMCSNFAIDGDERTFVKRLLTEIYPDKSFSMVSDSYDYWNMVDNILPSLKSEIMAHKGTLSVRGDSGDPVEIVTETVFRLWNTFGGTVNSKGYKVLDPHMKAIYGDSITPQRCRKIYEILTKNGFACNNVTLGVGSFSMQCMETFDENGEVKYSPFTRDTFGIAVKATYAEDADGNSIMIYKNPKTDNAHFKKSQRGCCSVHETENGFEYVDGLTFAEHDADKSNVLQKVFEDGKFVRMYTLSEIRNRLHNGAF